MELLVRESENAPTIDAVFEIEAEPEIRIADAIDSDGVLKKKQSIMMSSDTFEVSAMVPRRNKGGDDYEDEDVMADAADDMDLPSAAPMPVASLCSSKVPSSDEARGEELCETLLIMAK